MMKKILYNGSVLAMLAVCAFPLCSQAQLNDLNPNGNVGIGTNGTAPVAPLHVVSANTSALVIQSTAAPSGAAGAFVRLYNTGTPTAAGQRLGGVLFGAMAPAGITGAQIEALTESPWTIGSAHGSAIRFLTVPSTSTGPLERMRITSEGHILLQLNEFLGVAFQDRFNYDGKSHPQYGMQWLMDSWSTSGPTMWAAAFGGMKFFTRGTPRLSITGDGKIGINTTDTKGYQFAVNGDAIFTKIKVKLNASWPDYVLAKDYQLPSLSMVAAYIKEHNHLPEMPTAAEVEKDGMDVAEMNRTLVKKVEELTLYLIDQQKQLTELKKQNEQLLELIRAGHQ